MADTRQVHQVFIQASRERVSRTYLSAAKAAACGRVLAQRLWISWNWHRIEVVELVPTRTSRYEQTSSARRCFMTPTGHALDLRLQLASVCRRAQKAVQQGPTSRVGDGVKDKVVLIRRATDCTALQQPT